MGKFDGVLIASDFDNTMVYTEGALRSGGPVPAISRENRDAIGYFMAQGGTFSVATGRALPSFASVMDGVPMNGPTVLFNGAAIYDFPAGRYLRTAFLPECIRDHVRQLSQLMPGLTYEIYHDDNSISIELHIIVENGVNLPAVCRSIMNEVRYVVTRNTGVTVKDVDVCVDSMTL